LVGSRRMAGSGSRGSVLLEAADAFVVVLAARRSWCCCHRLFAVLLRFRRRGTGLAAKGRAGPGVFPGARLRVVRRAAGRLCAGLPPGRAG